MEEATEVVEGATAEEGDEGDIDNSDMCDVGFFFKHCYACSTVLNNLCFRGYYFIDRGESMMTQFPSSCVLFSFLIFGHLAPGVRLSKFGLQGERSETKNVHWLTKKGDEVENFPVYHGWVIIWIF